MKIKEVIERIEEKYPASLKEKWDNTGLIVGDFDEDITKIVVTLDVTMSVIDEAIEKGVNLIISHHPLIFNSVSNITTKTNLGKKILKLISNGIAVYSMHTNLDIANDGLNDYLTRKLELINVNKIDKEEYGEEYIRTGEINQTMSLDNFASYVKEKLDLDYVTVVSNNLSKEVKKIAICSGSGKDFINDAKMTSADCYITGDINYHSALDALEDDFHIIDAGHYGTEKIVVELLKEFLMNITEIEIIKSERMINPFSKC